MSENPVLTDDVKAKLDAVMGKLEKAEDTAGPRTFPPEGKDIDTDFWMVDDAIRHLYVRAKLIDGHYFVDMTEWMSVVRNYGGEPTRLHADGTPSNLGSHITMTTNGPDGWVLFNVLPSGAGMGCAVYRRTVRTPLPDPIPVGGLPPAEQTEADLQELDERTRAWANEQANG